jgi:hypothetical protein
VNIDYLAAFIAEVLMPDAPELIAISAEQVARALLERNAVVELPEPTFEDENGTTWSSSSGDFQLATVAGLDAWVAGEILSVDELEETAAALLAASRMVAAARAEVPLR